MQRVRVRGGAAVRHAGPRGGGVHPEPVRHDGGAVLSVGGVQAAGREGPGAVAGGGGADGRGVGRDAQRGGEGGRAPVLVRGAGGDRACQPARRAPRRAGLGGDHLLHVRHDGRAQGRHADARQHRGGRGRRQRVRAGRERGRRAPVVPAAGAHVRAHRAGGAVGGGRGGGLLPGRRPADHGRPGRAAAHRVPVGAAPVQPHLRQDHAGRCRGRRAQGQAVQAGDGEQAVLAAPRAQHAQAVGQAGVQQGEGARGPGPRAHHAHGLRAAGEPRDGLPARRLRLPHAGGLRADGERGGGDADLRPRLHHGTRGRPAGLQRGEAGVGGRDGLPGDGHGARRGRGQRQPRHALQRPRRGVPARAQRVRGLLQEPGEDGGGAGRGRVAAHGRHWAVDHQRRRQDHRPQEEHLQAGPGRVRGRGEDREHRPGQPLRRPGLRVRRLAAVVPGGHRGAGRGVPRSLGQEQRHRGILCGAVRQRGRAQGHHG
mmetsp:Transcript_3128/g.9643  ORF Transcript_3128/g.9643 Transcript_3128/m.9643 type:complete len:484 (-) Transcript_3128:413-1864(-)